MSTLKVLCVDDHAFLAEGLRSRLALEPDIEFVGWLGSADRIVSEVQRTAADIVLLDIEMPGSDSFAAIEDLVRACPETRVIMLSAFVRDQYIDRALEAGAWGYLSKSDDPDEIIAALRTVNNGNVAFGQGVLDRCETGPDGRPISRRPRSRLSLLTPRETEVLALIGRGKARLDIAEILHRSPKTVDNHRAAIMEKLGIHDRGELIRFAIQEGLAEA